MRHHPADSLLCPNICNSSILTSTNPSHKPLPPPPKPPSLADRLSLFLPFTKLRASKEPPPAQPSPQSHHPIELANPLPYLRAFVPFQITAVNSILPSPDNNASLLLQQDLSMSSPDDVLSVELRLVNDTVSETVNTLSLTNISRWADEELGVWAREQALTGDINSIGWASGRYWKLACVRAKYWMRCRARFPGLLVGKGSVVLEERPHSKAKAQHRQQGREPNLNVGRKLDNAEDGAQAPFSRRAMLAEIGRQSLLFSTGGVSMLITWRIGFDWTGETESHVSASTSFPTSWRKADLRRSLHMVEDAFDRLVKERGVYEATRIVTNLLFPEVGV